MTLRLLSGFDNDNWKKIHCCRVFQKLLIECFLSKLLIVKVNDKEVLNSQFWQLDFSPKNGTLVTLIFWNKFSQSFCQFNFSKKNLENVKKLGKEKDFSGLIGEGKFREKLCFIGGETDRVKYSHENPSWYLLGLVMKVYKSIIKKTWREQSCT